MNLYLHSQTRYRIADQSTEPRCFLPQKSTPDPPPRPPKKLLAQLRDSIRVKGCSIRTEKTCVAWARRFILFHNKTHPREMGAPEIETFLTHLAVDLNVAASTQNQALCALLFLYKPLIKKRSRPRRHRCRPGQKTNPPPHRAHQS